MIIPGPAGVLQAALLRKHADVMEGGHENVLPTQEYVRQIIYDPSEDDYFTSGPWLGAVVYLHDEGIMASGCLGDMKLEWVIGVIMSCTSNALGDLTVTLKDPSGTMGGTILY
ncbi:reverse transcriptase domain-containing protein [Tanacetum coccineum]